MDFDKIMSMLQGKTEPQLVRFVSDKGLNSCQSQRCCFKIKNIELGRANESLR